MTNPLVLTALLLATTSNAHASPFGQIGDKLRSMGAGAHERHLDESYAERYRGESGKELLPASAAVLPVQQCNTTDPRVKKNADTRETAALVVPPALWGGLHVSGTPKTGSDASLCGIMTSLPLGRNGNQGLSPAQLNTVGRALAANPGKDAIVVPYYFVPYTKEALGEDIRDANGRLIGSVETGNFDRQETISVVVGAQVMAADGNVWGVKMMCGGWDQVSSKWGWCTADKAQEVSATLLEGFPWSSIGLEADSANAASHVPASGAVAPAGVIGRTPRASR